MSRAAKRTMDKSTKHHVLKSKDANLRIVDADLADESLDEVLDESDRKELADIRGSSHADDANFQSELTYDGYNSIEEYDNGVYSSDVDNRAQSVRGVEIEDREADDTIEMGEESLVDPQGNQG